MRVREQAGGCKRERQLTNGFDVGTVARCEGACEGVCLCLVGLGTGYHEGKRSAGTLRGGGEVERSFP